MEQLTHIIIEKRNRRLQDKRKEETPEITLLSTII